jgi:N-acetylmuramoyl-L-alanine amidase
MGRRSFGAFAALAGLLALVAVVGLAAVTATAPGDSGSGRGMGFGGDAKRVMLGHSVQGRAIAAVRVGNPGSPNKALVVGAIHGDEPAGTAVTRRIVRRFAGLGGVDLWVVRTVNPDGLAAGQRRNTRGVDLNRNFSYRWQAGSPSSGYYPGPHPFSEPESRAVRRLIRLLKPRLTIWFHQPWGQVLAPCHGPAPAQRQFSGIAGIPLKRCRGQHLPGTATSWQNHRVGGNAFVVELPDGSISERAAGRDALAVVKVARTPAESPRLARTAGAGNRRLGGIRPPMRNKSHPPRLKGHGRLEIARKTGVKQKRIPFPAHRKREMAAYSKRHYGRRRWKLRDPKVIVEHIAVAGSVDSIFNTFAPDHPDPELHELPNVCSHFVVGSDGTSYQLVSLRIRCRHTVGLNYTAIGIEHVGFSDGDVLGDRRQLRGSLRLTQRLRCRFGISIRNVIGHNESLSSPYHYELVPSLKHQTHGDWRHASMQIYRKKLRHLGSC